MDSEAVSDLLGRKQAAIELFRGVPYSSSVSGAAGRYGDTYGTTSTAKLYCDGERKSVSAYTINDYTYYKLRDLAKLLDMGVTWEEGSATIRHQHRKKLSVSQ